MLPKWSATSTPASLLLLQWRDVCHTHDSDSALYLSDIKNTIMVASAIALPQPTDVPAAESPTAEAVAAQWPTVGLSENCDIAT